MEDKTIVLEQCATDNMVADVLTKGLPTPAFEKHKSEMIGEKSNTCSVYVVIVMVYVQESYWIDLQYHNTTQIYDVLIVLLHCKVVRCEYKEERGNTYALFNLERLSHATGLWGSRSPDETDGTAGSVTHSIFVRFISNFVHLHSLPPLQGRIMPRFSGKCHVKRG